MLKINDIDVSYHNKGKKIEVLQNFSLELEQGEVLAVLGPSGCGKSTLIQLLAGMLKQDSGKIVVVGKDKEVPHNPKTQRIAVIPQNLGLLPWKTVKQNCLLPLELHKIKVDKSKLNELMELCKTLQVDSLLERYPRELSGGQAQRVALARAFLQYPDLLLMDEPFSSLDEMTRLDGWELFLKSWKKNKPTTIIVTHSIEEALYLGKNVLVLDKEKGRILERINNPYFGIIQSDEAGYLQRKKELRALLGSVTGRTLL